MPHSTAPRLHVHRSTADLARNACDEYGDLFGPEEEAGSPHFGPEPDWTDYERWTVCQSDPNATLLQVARAIGCLQGIAMRLRTPGLNCPHDAAARLDAVAADLAALAK